MNSYVDFSKQSLPPIYQRKNKDCYFDPIREKLIYITPEETVRQQVISYLINELQVPKRMIDVEVHLSHYGVKSKRRADILINKYVEEDNALVPLCVVECKAPGIMLGNSAQNQMIDYCDALVCDFSMITNGYDVQCYHYNEKTNSYDMIKELPMYLEQVKGMFTPAPEIAPPPRLLHSEIGKNWGAYIGSEMGDSITEKLAVPMVNFWEGLIYNEHLLPQKKYEIFEVIEDIGMRLLSYGNASGGVFQGPYRSFMIDYKGSTEIVSIGVSTYVSNAKPDIIKTSICVAIDNEKETHHSLQLVVEDNVSVDDNKVTFYHHGRIGISNKGSGKVSELRQFVAEQYPDIIDGNKFNLGTLVNDHLWNLDESDMMKVVENMISYALVRDEYRNYVKNR